MTRFDKGESVTYELIMIWHGKSFDLKSPNGRVSKIQFMGASSWIMI